MAVDSPIEPAPEGMRSRPEERLLAQARQILNDHDGEVTPGYLARKLKVGMQKASRIHQTLVADEAAAYALPPHADD